MILRLAWRNLWRQPRRTVLSLLSIGFAALVTVWLLALQQGVYATMKGNVLRLFDGFAQVQPPGYAASPDIRKTVSDPDRLVRRIEALGLTATPRASGYAIVSGPKASLGAEVAGVEPAGEVRLSSIPATIRSGRYLHPGDNDAIVLGATLARNLHVTVGDRVTVLGSARDGSVAADALTVVGTFRSGVAGLDRQLAEMPLDRFRSDFALGGDANLIVAGGPSLDAVNSALPALRRIAGAAGLVVRDWGDLEPGLKDAIHLDASTSLLWYGTLIVVVVFIILNTLLMTVLERTREFGVLLALGMRHSLLGRTVWLELILLAALGLVVGMAGGAVLTGWLAVHGLTLPGGEAVFAQWGLPGRIYPQLTVFSLSAGPAAIGTGVVLIGAIPYRRIRRLQPVAAMQAA